MTVETAQLPVETSLVGLLHQYYGMLAGAGAHPSGQIILVMKKRYNSLGLYRFLLCYCEFLCTPCGGMLHCAPDLCPVHFLEHLQVYNLSDFGGYEVYSVVPEHLLVSVGLVPRVAG